MFKLKRLRRRAVEGWREFDRCRRRTRDVAVISYPKSGRTWLRFMVHHTGMRLLYDHAGAENRLALPVEAIADRVSDWKDWRVIFLFRDPRDTAVSSYFEATKRIKKRHRYAGSISEFVRDPRFGVEKIARFNLLWLQSLSDLKAAISVSYEDLHQSTATELSRVLHFANGRSASDTTVQSAVAAGRFQNMRKIELALAGNMNELNKLGGGSPGDVESFKTRRGRVGGWRDYFEEHDQHWMEQRLLDLHYWEQVSVHHPVQTGLMASTARQDESLQS